ncbi:MAG: hypothetical protein Q4D56_08335 [Bacteroides sp.]|nr:hypothetical protein [Bacteroides sp.]
MKRANISICGLYNPEDPTESKDFSPIFYDINTIGWTTDIVTSPFRNFNLHFLLTLQNPQYRNLNYNAYGVNYDYNGKVIPELSKVLIEIDPSFYMMKRKLRAWLSFRYFGKQYANPTNAFYYNGWWENFGGLDYTVNRNVTLKFQAVNFLNQTGIKGAIQGADQEMSDSEYIGRTVVATGIRPRTFEFTVDIRF